MKTLLGSIAAVVALTSCARQPSTSDAARSIASLERGWANATQHRDSAALERFMSPSYATYNAGQDSTRAPTTLAMWRNAILHVITLDTIITSRPIVDVYDDSAVATLWLWSAPRRGAVQITPNNNLVRDTWVRAGDGWQVIHRHVVPRIGASYVISGSGPGTPLLALPGRYSDSLTALGDERPIILVSSDSADIGALRHALGLSDVMLLGNGAAAYARAHPHDGIKALVLSAPSERVEMPVLYTLDHPATLPGKVKVVTDLESYLHAVRNFLRSVDAGVE